MDTEEENNIEDDGFDDWSYCPTCGDLRGACLCGHDPWEGQLVEEE